MPLPDIYKMQTDGAFVKLTDFGYSDLKCALENTGNMLPALFRKRRYRKDILSLRYRLFLRKSFFMAFTGCLKRTLHLFFVTKFRNVIPSVTEIMCYHLRFSVSCE